MENVPVFVPVFLYAVTMLIFADEKNYFKWKMVQLRRYYFFFENAKNLGRSDDAKRRKKKEDGLSNTS